MKRSRIFLSTIILLLAAAAAFAFTQDNDTFLTYRVNPKKPELKLYWRDADGLNYRSIQNLKTAVEKEKKKLLFATNGGMYKPDGSPVGLYIQNKVTLSPLDTTSGSGNFYLKPNGVFYITTDNTAAICTTADFKDNGKIKYATQSGPMLVINGQIHPALKEGSLNKNIRNGVGILPDGTLIFVLSKQPVNFYDFADYFKKQGCKNALYLDGFVSRAYLPEKNWVQLDGEFGVIVGVTGK
ncbi:phosphodiester glycosidase family protein [Mucilaginibacter psychrotolerans]|uniref:Phosphodiester glycosidase domain-containing protein n=1 Tax=Mucilaginibacter psychrotolerans TaxID=1524096 RepID=A0A4Y8S6P8_9SPHI|nr:phosphodiester glycosidase family protein [Mucilaginibacter psychrotolerans]TFF34301.1 hypothetical protein E2R66_22465 [Mucilaginibacter psychrotolerans]